MVVKKRGIGMVEWYDAQQNQGDENFIESLQYLTSGKELLAVNLTYGEIVILKDVVVVIHERSTSSTNDYSAIPRRWVKKITWLK